MKKNPKLRDRKSLQGDINQCLQACATLDQYMLDAMAIEEYIDLPICEGASDELLGQIVAWAKRSFLEEDTPLPLSFRQGRAYTAIKMYFLDEHATSQAKLFAAALRVALWYKRRKYVDFLEKYHSLHNSVLGEISEYASPFDWESIRLLVGYLGYSETSG
jgi:hypothetical protein